MTPLSVFAAGFMGYGQDRCLDWCVSRTAELLVKYAELMTDSARDDEQRERET